MLPNALRLCLCLLLASLTAHAGGTLRVLAWPGYADPDLVQTFERQHDARVEVTFVTTDDDLWERASAQGGESFDVLAVNLAELQRLVNRGLVVPIKPDGIPNTRHQLKRFRDPATLPALQRDGKLYAVPYTYAEMGLIYNRKLVKTTPTSMAALWEPRYRGRILLYEGSSHNFSMAALLAGISNPFQLSDANFNKTVKQLIALRANRPLLYSSPEEVVKLFRTKPVALAFGNYGGQQIKALRASGQDVGYIIPSEGALAWLDCWAVLMGGRDNPLASAWINYTLNRDVSRQLTLRHGLSNTIEPSADSTEEDKLVWLQPVEDPERRAQFWQRILSGYRRGMF